MSTVCAAATQHEDIAGLLCVLIGALLYGATLLRDYISDVRYYRARKIVRERRAG